MAQMPQRVQRLFDDVSTAVLATSTPDGKPNAAIAAFKTVLDDETVYISDQMFWRTKENVQANPNVAIIFHSIKGAFQIHGTAEYVTEGEVFEAQKPLFDAELHELGYDMFQARGGIIVHVDAVFDQAAGANCGEQIA